MEITGLTAEAMQAIRDGVIVDAEVVGDNLILTKFDATTIDAGNVRGPQGVAGPAAPDATAGVKGIIQLTGDLGGTAASPQIAAGAIVNADVNASAAIVYSKLSLSNSVKYTDIAKDSNGLAGGSFMAHRSTTGLAIPNNTATVVPFNSEEWDISNWYDTATGRFTPQEKGYYHFDASIMFSCIAGDQLMLQFYKNGSLFKRNASLASSAAGCSVSCSCDCGFNGTTDWLAVYAYWYNAGGGAARNPFGSTEVFFNGHMIGRAS